MSAASFISMAGLIAFLGYDGSVYLMGWTGGYCLLAMLLAPLYSGWILKVKAWFGGRKGSPVLINYYTLIKLFQKGSVYSTSTTLIFKLGPMVSLCAATVVLMFLPVAGQPPLFSFNGDVILLLYLLGLGRFFTIAAAMARGGAPRYRWSDQGSLERPRTVCVER